jgi:D-3-phosphoglycerate dehydrogenase
LICKKATTKRVAGIGGVFFKAQNTDKMKGLYGKHLGFNCDQYGTSFSWRKKEKS